MTVHAAGGGPGAPPRVLLAALRARWFDEVVQSPLLAQAMQADLEAATQALRGAGLEVAPHVVDAEDAAKAVARCIQIDAPDLVVLLFQVWAEDGYLIPIGRAVARRPWAVWLYQPATPPPYLTFDELLRYSGAVGALQGLGLLHHMAGAHPVMHARHTVHAAGEPAAGRFVVVAGDPGRAVPPLAEAARGARMVRALANWRIGLVPGPNPQMLSTYVNEAAVAATWGVRIERASVAELAEAVNGVGAGAVEPLVAQLSRWPAAGVDGDSLPAAARASLGLAHLAEARGWQAVSLNDIDEELHRTLGLRPCLYPPALRDRGRVVGLEGDVGAALALSMLQLVGGSPLMFLEIFTWDEGENLLIAGHAGVQDDGAADVGGGVELVRDLEFHRSDALAGVWLSFRARPGPVTLLQVRAGPDGWRATAVEGECLDGPRRVEGYPHAVVRPDVPVPHLFETLAQEGSTQHWAMGYGHHARALVAAHRWLGVPLTWVRG